MEDEHITDHMRSLFIAGVRHHGEYHFLGIGHDFFEIENFWVD